MQKRTTFFVCLLVLFFEIFFCQVKVSNTSGNWSNPAIWTPTGVPGPAEDVIILSTHTVTLDVTATCNSLTIGTNVGAAQLLFSGNTPLTLTINGDLTIANAASFLILSNSNTTHSLMLNGNIVNNGNLRFFQDINSLCDVLFTGNGNRTVSGTGLITRFNNMVLNMGTSINNILEITTPTFSAATNFLTLYNGTFKFSSPGNTSIEPFRNLTSIPVTAGLWLNSPGAVANTNSGINIGGLLKISAGSLAVGNGVNEDLTSNGGTLSVTGGTLVVAGKYNAASAAGTFGMAGGLIQLARYGTTHTSIAPFHVSAAGAYVTMSGGTIVIEREGGTGSQDLGYVCTGSVTASISGGTLQIGNNNSPPNQTITINTAQPLPGLVLNSNAVTAKLINNDLTVINNIHLVTGTLTANNFNISLGGSWENTGLFLPGSGMVTFDSGAPQYLLCPAGETFHHLTMNGIGVKTFSSSLQVDGNFSINPGSLVDAGMPSFSLTVKNNFSNSGIFNARNGTVILNGNNAQGISGSATTNFYNLTIDNPAGVTLNNPENIEGTLSLNNGTLNTNTQPLTLVSNSVSTGRIAEITGSGDINGDITVQRFVAGGATGWVFLGTPIASPLTLNDWDDDIFISCPTCPDGSAAGFLSLYTYDETQPGLYDDAAAYVALGSVNDPILPGRGYWVYLGSDFGTTDDLIIDMTGSVRKFNYTIPLDFTNYGSSINDGWNLIHNPYPSTISWTALKGSTPDLDNAIYVYNPDLNAGAGGYASYVNGISSPAINAGGIDDNIAMCQGFYVHSTGATSLNAQESNKVNNPANFLKQQNNLMRPTIRLALSNSTTWFDETVLYFEAGAGNEFNAAHDAYKMRPFDPTLPVITIWHDSIEFQVNGVAPLNGDFTIPLKVTSGTSGTYSIAASEISNFPLGTCIRLYDTWNNTVTDLKNSGYSFYLADTTLFPRFELHISLHPLDIDSFVTQPDCLFPDAGIISVKGRNNGPWNYIWKHNASEIKRSFNKTEPDSLQGLRKGVYELELNSTGLCDNSTSSYTIHEQIPVKAQFVCADSLLLKPFSILQCTNTSVGAETHYWLSGLTDYTSSLVSPVFTYTLSGIFNLRLFCVSKSGCLDSASKKVVILDSVSKTVVVEQSPGLVLKSLGNNIYLLEVFLDTLQNVEIKLFDGEGRIVTSHTGDGKKDFELQMDLGTLAKGVYFARVFVEGVLQKAFKLPAY